MSQVVIDDVIPRTQLVATASQTVFNTNWTADADTDILVYARADGVEPDDATQLVSSTLYSVTFIGASETVRVTFLSGRTADDVITIVRNTPADRENLYINTNFTPSMLNQDFGILTLVDQQAQMYDTVINPGYNVSATISDKDKVLPILGANQIWAMNPDNDEIITYDVPSSGGLAPDDGKYILQEADVDLPNAQALDVLPSGFVVNTNGTGVLLSRTLSGTTDQIDISNGTGISGNPSFSVADNAIFPGTAGIGIPVGSTAQRVIPSSSISLRFNNTDGKMEYYNGSVWIQIAEDFGVLSIVGTSNEIDVDNSDPENPVISIPNQFIFPGTFEMNGSTVIDDIINDDTMATATATNLSSSLAIKNYVDNSDEVNPGLINELAWYAASGQVLSGLTTGNSGTLITSAGGVPSISSTLPSAVQTNITKLGTQSQTLDMGTHIISGVTDPSSAQDAATKNYVDAAVAGLTPQDSVNYASTTALTVTYANGASGVGATLTNAGAQAAFSLDGGSPTAGMRVLIKDQASTLQNGVYTVTDVGSGATNWILTRAVDFDTPTEINNSGIVPVTSGTANIATGWLETATITTIGTDPIVFIQFGQTAGTVPVSGGGTGVTSLTTYAPLIGGTTTTNPVQQVTLGASGTLFQSAGVGALPGFTTTTYPATNAINTIMYASSANVLGSIAAANSSVMVSSAGGVPSFSTTLPAGLTIPGYQATITPAALTKTDDTNVTLTLGGTPTTALLQATSITAGWTGQLGLTRGGTAASLTASNGGIVYSTAGALAILSGTATANQMLLSGASGAPAWSTTTHPSTIAQGDLLYGSATNVISALAKNTSSTRYLSNTGTTNNPAWSQVDLSNGVTGNLPVTNLNSGTSASATTYWSGAGTWTTPAGGSSAPIKVQQTFLDTTVSLGSISTFTDVTGLAASITPASSSNKVLVSVCLNGWSTGSGSPVVIRITRNGTAVGIGASAGSRTRAGSSTTTSVANPTCVTLEFLDSPASGSSVTYQVQAVGRTSSASGVYCNRYDTDSDSATTLRTASSITLIEVNA